MSIQVFCGVRGEECGAEVRAGRGRNVRAKDERGPADAACGPSRDPSGSAGRGFRTGPVSDVSRPHALFRAAPRRACAGGAAEHHRDVGAGTRRDPLRLVAEAFGRVRLERVDRHDLDAAGLKGSQAARVLMNRRAPVDVVRDRRIGAPEDDEFGLLPKISDRLAV